MKRVVAILSLLFSFSCSYACNCAGKKGLEKSDVVFKGDVLSVRLIDSAAIRRSRYYEVTFKADTIIKGDLQTKTVTIIMDGHDCFVPMKENERFIVYALYYNDTDLGKILVTGSCFQTRKLSPEPKVEYHLIRCGDKNSR